jgi:hypothetical protein
MSARKNLTAAERRARMDDNALFALHAKLMDRVSEQSEVLEKGLVRWTRFDDDQQCQRNGIAWKNSAGRAKGQIDTAQRIMAEIEGLLAERGYTDDEIVAHYRQHCEDREREAMQADDGYSTLDAVLFEVTDGGDVVLDEATPAPVFPAPVAAPTRPPARASKDRFWWVEALGKIARRSAPQVPPRRRR